MSEEEIQKLSEVMWKAIKENIDYFVEQLSCYKHLSHKTTLNNFGEGIIGAAKKYLAEKKDE